MGELSVLQAKRESLLDELLDVHNNIIGLRSDNVLPGKKLVVELDTSALQEKVLSIWLSVPNSEKAFFQILKCLRLVKLSDERIVSFLRFEPLHEYLLKAGFGLFFSSVSKRDWYFDTVNEWLKKG